VYNSFIEINHQLERTMNLTNNKIHHQTPCATSVLNFFGVKGVTWNARTQTNVWDQTLRRAGFSVRSRMSKLKQNERTVGSARKRLAEVAKNEPELLAFVVRVNRHVLVLDRNGNTVVDTSPRKRDRRDVLKVVAVFKA